MGDESDKQGGVLTLYKLSACSATPNHLRNRERENESERHEMRRKKDEMIQIIMGLEGQR